MRIAFDLDGTVVRNGTVENKFLDAEVDQLMLELVNSLYDDGHEIYFFTARDQYYQAETEEWLREKGFKFHYCIFSKPFYHIFIDDRALGWKDGLTQENLEKLMDMIKDETLEQKGAEKNFLTVNSNIKGDMS